jgi:putative chitinase
MLTVDLMRQMWPQGNSKIPELIEGIVASSAATFDEFGLNSDVVIAHAMGQFSHECGAGTTVVEGLNYSAQGLLATWPTRFNAASAARFAHNQQLIANEVYNGRMGNRTGTDDGWNYRGRGGSQVTGHDGYKALGDKIGLNLVNEPDLVNHPEHFLRCAVADFVICGCLPFAKSDDVQGVTYHLNGGLIGLSSRIDWTQRWKAALHGQDPNERGALWAQQTLNRLGADPQMICDGMYGPVTVAAITAFQQKHGLTADGKLGPQTIAALEKALQG